MAILSNHPDLAITNWHGDHEGRVLAADISVRLEKFHVTNIYAPQCAYTVQQRSSFFDSLYCYTYSPYPTILTGDFNMVDNPRIDRDPPTTKNDPTQALRDLCTTFNLRDTFRSIHGNTRLFTRRQGQTQSRLDRFYACGRINPLSEYTTLSLMSDHDVVVSEISSFAVSTHGKGRWKNNAAIYDDPSFKMHLNTKWRQWCTRHPVLFSSAVDWWTHIKARIKNLNIFHAKIKRREQMQHENFLRKQVETLCQEISYQPMLLPLYYSLKKEWSHVKRDQAHARVKKSKIHDFQNKDRGTKDFFQQLAQNRKRTSITVISNTIPYSATCRNHFFDSLYLYFHTKHPTILTGDFNVLNNPFIGKTLQATSMIVPIHFCFYVTQLD